MYEMKTVETRDEGSSRQGEGGGGRSRRLSLSPTTRSLSYP
jgi:hypothetical protein